MSARVRQISKTKKAEQMYEAEMFEIEMTKNEMSDVEMFEVAMSEIFNLKHFVRG